MAPGLDIVSNVLPLRSAKRNATHPFAALSGDEIKNAVNLIRAQWPENTNLHFKQVTLSEPLKAEAVHFIEAEIAGASLPVIDRKVFVTYYIRSTVSLSMLFRARMGADTHRTNTTRLSLIFQHKVLNTIAD